MCDLPLRDKALKERGLKELSTLQLKGVIKSFADLGIAGIGFTGGEPLLRADIYELLKYTKELNMITHLNTNGFFLNEKSIEKILIVGVDSLNISLDGADENTHDEMRRHPGAFNKVMKAIACINEIRKKKNFRIRLKTVTVINEMNIDQIPDLLQLAIKLRIDCLEFIPQQPFAFSEDNSVYDAVFFEKLRKYIDYIEKFKQGKISIENSPRHLKLFEKSFRNAKMPFSCYAGYNSYAVDCYGEIYPCVPWFNWDRSIGNLADLDLKKFWYSDRYNKVRKEILKCKGCYLNCQSELNLLFNLKYI